MIILKGRIEELKRVADWDLNSNMIILKVTKVF